PASPQAEGSTPTMGVSACCPAACFCPRRHSSEMRLASPCGPWSVLSWVMLFAPSCSDWGWQAREPIDHVNGWLADRTALLVVLPHCKQLRCQSKLAVEAYAKLYLAPVNSSGARCRSCAFSSGSMARIRTYHCGRCR